MTRKEIDTLHTALSCVWFGADRLDAEAVADQLETLGWQLTPIAQTRVDPPRASTSRPPKVAS